MAKTYKGADVTYKFELVAKPSIEEDIALVNKQLATYEDASPVTPEYIKRMERADCYYLYKNESKVAFAYILLDTSVNPLPVGTSVIVIDNTDRAIPVVLFYSLISLYDRIVMFPHTKNLYHFRTGCSKESLLKFHQGIKKYITISKTRLESAYSIDNAIKFFGLEVV